MDFSIGIDLGGTHLTSALVDGRGGVTHPRNIALTEVDKSVEQVIALIAQEVDRLRGAAEGEIVGVGCGIPGIVEVKKGIVFQSPHFPFWNDVPFLQLLQERISFSVFLDNDANCFALGEARFGAGRQQKNFVMLTLGSGIGGGIILNGDLWHGDVGFAAEIGHVVIKPDGVPCGCGGRGCLEQYAAASLFERYGIDPKQATPELWREFGGALGVGISSVINVLGITTFVIAGGLSNAWEHFIDVTRETIASHSYRKNLESLQLLRSELGDEGGIIGAASLCFTAKGVQTP